MRESSVFSEFVSKMNGIIFLTCCILAVIVPSYAQFNLPFDNDCTAGRLIDPFLIHALKSKYPKKYNAKLDFGKDLALEAKYKLGTAKQLARHMKNLNALNYDMQNLIYQQQQQAMMQQPSLVDPTLALAQQQQQQQQQQQLLNLQNTYDAARSLLTPQADPQLAAYAQLTDQRYQQPAYQLTAQSLTSLRPQHSLYQAGTPVQL